jgi:adenosylmethionine-8-amino-7-oxononanoate aminotransferase
MTNLNADFDRNHIWHPYTSMTTPLPVYPVVSAQGVYLTLEDGRQLIDGMSSWWACIHGYNVPQLNQAAKQQLDKMAHVMFGGITHPPAVELCQRLVEMTPQGLNKVFLADSGSVAVEVAIKMALQYWQGLGQTRHKLASIRSGYHGDTFGAMSVTDPEGSMHSLYQGFVAEHYFADAPQIAFGDTWDPADLISMSNLLAAHHQEIAAVILEPIVQGAGGMRFYHPDYLKGVRALCDRYKLLLIADEIATGFGRTGQLFACDHAGITPDILCLGKAITGGYMTLAATLTTDKVSQAISQSKAGVFMHGPTFMGNPLACAVACASLEQLKTMNWPAKVAAIETQLKTELAKARSLPQVKGVRVLGAIGVIETHEIIDVAAIQKHFVELGVWIRPFGKLVYVMPPYVIERQQLSQLTHAMIAAIAAI